MLFRHISIGLTPAAEMVEHASFPLIVQLPITAIRATVCVVRSTTTFLGILRISRLFRVFGVLGRLFSLILKLNSFFGTVNTVSLKTICKSIPSFRPRLNVSNDPAVILSSDLPGGIGKTSEVTRQASHLENVFEVTKASKKLGF